MNRFSKFCALCAALIMSASSFAANLADYEFPSWNDYEITFSDPDGLWGTRSAFVESKSSVAPNSTISLSATVTVDGDATLCFENAVNYFSMTVSVDGNEVSSYNNLNVEAQRRRFVELQAGTHTITWSLRNIHSSKSETARIFYIGIKKTPAISVNLLEPGSLGTEVLYYVDRLQDAHKLKIKGELNDDDWEKIDMMKANLFALDLSEAKISEIANSRFQRCGFLHTVVLPEGLKRIGDYAFDNSPLVNVNFPSTLTTLGIAAFRSTCLKEANINEACITWVSYNENAYQFAECQSLRSVTLPKALSIIGYGAFEFCRQLNVPLHEGITTIQNYAFFNCSSMHPVLPSTLTTIGNYAFSNVNDFGERQTELVIPDNVTTIAKSAFDNTWYTSAVVSASYNSITVRNPLPSTVKTIKLKSPTVVTHNYNITSAPYSDLTLIVPDYLVNAYKLDKKWYNFGKIEGFDTEEVTSWRIVNDLVLDAHARLKGAPSVAINASGSLKINGTDGMPLNNLTVSCERNAQIYGRIFSNADGVTVAGSLLVQEYVVKNRWYYLSLPYNVKVGDIYNNNGAQKAIRYYDGANRAQNGTGNNWKNYADTDIIPAGTGFIFQSSADGWWNFPAQNDESKQYMTSNRVFVKGLEANTSATASNSGWNLVGNPYQCWYNIHTLNFTAPITVRNESSNKYEAYSIIDDDYAIRPNQAFFVQCPEGTSSISFPLNGRQMTSEILSQNGAPARYPSANGRVLVDLSLNNGEDGDRTRVVMNNEASMGYEMTCDASKFLSESNVAQIYTLDDEGTMYAINERPMMNGEVKIGIVIPQSGTYSLALLRSMAGSVCITDNETGETVDITREGYEFYAEAGTHENRFTLVINAAGDATGIATVGSKHDEAATYNLSGQKVSRNYKGIVIENGKKIMR